LINTFNSLEEAFSEAIKAKGKNAKVLVIPYGSSTLPNFRG